MTERTLIPMRVPPEWVPELTKAADRRKISRNEFFCRIFKQVLEGEKLKYG